MIQRDLKADLEQLKRTKKVFEPQQVTFETPEDEIVPAIDILDQQLYTIVGLGEFVVEYGEEWLERAIEAEALVRELAEALESVSAQLSNTLEVPIPLHTQQLIAKVKEVLRDDALRVR